MMDKLVKKKFKSPKERIKTYVKMFFRVWNGLTKYIKSQTYKGRLVRFSLLGSFYQQPKPETEDQDFTGVF